jgi:hypothetical protein
MATQLQIRRGTSSQVAAFTGAEGEIVVNTTNDSIVVSDGSTAGGFEMARADLNNVSDTSLNAALTGNTVSALTVTSLTSSGINVTGTVTADGLTSSGNIFLDGSGNPSVINKTSGAGNNPIYRLQADTNYWDLQGTFSNTDDELFFIYNGSTKMAITNAGNVGIGTSSPRTRLDLGANGVSAMRWGTWSELGEESSHNTLVIGNNVYVDGNTTKVRATSSDGYRAIKMKFSDGITFHTASGSVTADATVSNERMRIDAASGNVGIGTSSPSSYNSAGDNLVIAETTGGAGLTLASSTTGSGHILFADGTSGTGAYDGFIRFDHTTSSMRFASGGGTERMRIGSDGTTGFFGAAGNTRSDITMTTGTSDSSKRWGFGGGATGNNAVFYVINESNVGVYLGHGAQGWIAHSDERIKSNITSVGTVLPSLMNMRCVKFNLISNPAVTKIGFIAQDWESAFPEIVDENEHLVLEADGTIGTEDDSDSTTPVKAMAYTETIPLLLKAIQEQQATIETLTTRLTALENN